MLCASSFTLSWLNGNCVAGCLPGDGDTCPLDSEFYPLGLITCIPTYTNKPTSILLTMGALKNSLLHKHSTNLKNGEMKGEKPDKE